MRPSITDALATKILVLDGAMGTMLQTHDLSASDFGGEAYEGCNEYLSITRPDVISSIHMEYLAAGADIIETNTFGATSIVLSEYGLEHRSKEINRESARLARMAADAASTPQWPRFVAGAMGPTTKSLSLTGGATFEELRQSYREQVLGLLDGGVDLLIVETSQDMLNVKAAAIGIHDAFEEVGTRVPVMVSGTIEPMGTTLAGQNIEAFYLAIEHLQPIAVGLNCATGPEFMRDHVRTLAGISSCAVSCYPNAGLPDEEGHYHETPMSFATKLAEFAGQGWVNIVGGCCGTTPAHIKALREVMDTLSPRTSHGNHPPAISGLEAVYLEADNRPILVGERSNVIGSKKFRRLIQSGDYDAAAEVARTQVRNGAQVIDVCLADPDRDEAADMEAFLARAVQKVKVPFMIDSTDATVVELSLRHIQGKAIINSTNFEDGTERFATFARLAKTYGAALVVGTIDEQGMAVTRERKLEIAARSIAYLVQEFAFDPRDIIIDPLTFPVGTGDVNYVGAAVETIESIRMIKSKFPECSTILGVSNVSFGLPQAGREVLNSVFLYECTKAGLDYAIVNTEKLERYASIAPQERDLSYRILHEPTDVLIAEFTELYRDRKVVDALETHDLPLAQRLARYVVEGRRDRLTEDLAVALLTDTPLDIINGPLMAGMTEVGRLFNDNQLIVAEVLQSAEVMKAAVSYLQPFMEKTQTFTKGRVLLATVRGDVHDIGKNLVEIILTNNGYEVVNLGIKVTPDELIAAARVHNPDIIGLSGLLVKSAQQMAITAADLSLAKISVPILVGGAALTKKFTLNKIRPVYAGSVCYAKDAMHGLDLANQLIDPVAREALLQEQEREVAQLQSEANNVVTSPVVKESEGKSQLKYSGVLVPPDMTRHVLRDYPLSHLRPYLNLQMLLGKHLGLRKNVEQALAEGDEQATQLLAMIEDLMDNPETTKYLRANAVYQFFPATSHGNEIRIYNPENRTDVLERFEFPRQQVSPYLCLADFLHPAQNGVVDYVAFLTVTVGNDIGVYAKALQEQGAFLKSHTLQALALELAEAFAERVHHIIRDAWGFSDAPELTMRDRFLAKYQGIRVSFGYPACPNLEDQRQLFRLLKPEEIGVRLTDGDMMEPEASVSAMVFSHPQAQYFNVESTVGRGV